jgi:hypothetical protein
MNGSICIYEVLFNVCCAFNFGMMIQVNGVFALIKDPFPWNSLIAWTCFDLRGCIKHLNIVI